MGCRVYKRNFNSLSIARDIYINGQVDKDWWWKLQQKNLTNLAFIDYKELASMVSKDVSYCKPSEISRRQDKTLFRSFGGYVVECKEGRSKRGTYAKILIENNYRMYKVLVWSEQYKDLREKLKGSEKSLMVFSGELKYDPKWSKANQFTINDDSFVKIF